MTELTREQVAELRRLLDVYTHIEAECDDNPASDILRRAYDATKRRLHAAAINALPALLDAAERDIERGE